MGGGLSGPGSGQETEPGDESALSPEEALALVDAQRAQTSRSLHVHVPLILTLWGIAWLGGFGATYFTYGTGPVPPWLAVIVTVALNGLAAAVSIGQTIRRGRGVEGPTRQVTLLYAWAWPLAFVGLTALNAGLASQGMPARFFALLWPASATLVVGVLYLATGFLFQDTASYALGAWMLIAGAASVFAGVPGNFAVLALAGGGGFLVAALLWQRAWAHG